MTKNDKAKIKDLMTNFFIERNLDSVSASILKQTFNNTKIGAEAANQARIMCDR
jgi:hypothetical protein